MGAITEHTHHPKNTEQLFGHEKAERLFLEAFNSDRLHHAWLISGPKGVGKATLAWKIAKFLLSLPNEQASSAGLFGEDLPMEATSLQTDPALPSIQRLLSGGHGGLCLVERSLNDKTGKMRNDIVIDDIRKLIRFYEQTSSEGGWRVAIVDSADEMNSNAANALLKVLEEPPEKSIILLLAHSPGKLLPTIRSRCRALPLNILSPESIQAVLAQRFPDISAADLSSASVLAAGAPGRAIELVEIGGLKTYVQILELLSSLPRLDVPALHGFAEKLANIKADREYRLFIQLYQGLMQKIIRQHATKAALPEVVERESDKIAYISSLTGLDQWLDLWEKMGELSRRADSVNLDKKQVIINMFTSIAALARA